MRGARSRARIAVALGALLAAPGAFALNPALDVSQYAHTAWKISDGFFKGSINSMAQTPDGYLWLGTEFGLVRFDGVRPVEWAPPAGQQLPSDDVRQLFVTHDGTLWVGTAKGVASWKDGRLREYAEFAGLAVVTFLEDRRGTLWIGSVGAPNGKLCAFQNSRFHCDGADGSLGRWVLDLHEDSRGTLWVGTGQGVWHWEPGPRKFYPLPGENGVQGLAEDNNDGALLVSRRGGIRRLVDGKFAMAYPFPGAAGQYQAPKLLRDRDRSLWVGTVGAGLIHVHEGRTDVFSRSDGLSGDFILTLFEDHEGSIWVASADGLDRFRNFAASTFSVNQGLPNSLVSAVLAARDGTVWLNDFGLSRWDRGQITVYSGRSQNRSGLADHLTSLFQDKRGRVWAATLGGVGYLDQEQFVSVKEVPGGQVHAIAEDTSGNLWFAHQDLGLFELLPGSTVRRTPWTELGHEDDASALSADPVQGGLWIGFYQGGVSYFHNGQVSASYTIVGAVNDLRVDPDGTLWAAAAGGLNRLKNGQVATLNSKGGLPCDAVHWILEDDDHFFWLGTACGLVRVARAEVEAWASNQGGRKIQATVFDSSDGVRSQSIAGGYTPHAGKSPDGKLWFGTTSGLTMVDPRHLPFNRLPPPVHIEQITADRKTYAPDPQLRLPPLVRDLQIDYTALSFVDPEKVQFKFKLEGEDRDWHVVGNRRQAFYNDLPPRNYRFRVIASNDNGVWNEAGASLDFSVDPAYYQTTWFYSLVAAASLGLLAAIYQLRLRYLKHQFDVRLEARVGERTRIARDLHDTLLQSFQGVLLKFSTIQYLIRNRPDEAEETLKRAIEQARAAITEGRDAVQGLRSSVVVMNDLARAIATYGEALAADHAGPEFRVQVEGQSRDLPPLIRDEIYHIACESLRNAFRHAQARRIEVELRYDPRQFRLRVVDNGKGIDAAVLNAGGRAGHHGLPGLTERAAMAGGKLSVWSRPGAGTEIELAIPSALVYLKSEGQAAG